MTPEEAALAAVLDALDRLSIPYMLTGSIAASYHGRPRSTHDADIVIDPTPAALDALVTHVIDAGFYINPDGTREAMRRRRAFNAIEATHGCKIVLIPRRDRPFSEEEFRRRIVVDLPVRRRTAVVTAEDAVLSKLEWARLAGDSERQLADAAGVVALSPALDSRIRRTMGQRTWGAGPLAANRGGVASAFALLRQVAPNRIIGFPDHDSDTRR